MDKVKASQILGHQLKGIMLHVDLCKYALKLKDKSLARKQYHQVIEETKAFMLTNEAIIKKQDCIVEPVREARIIIPGDATSEKLRSIWADWEHDTLAVYIEAAGLEPECRLWKKLACAVKKELTTF